MLNHSGLTRMARFADASPEGDFCDTVATIELDFAPKESGKGNVLKRLVVRSSCAFGIQVDSIGQTAAPSVADQHSISQRSGESSLFGMWL